MRSYPEDHPWIRSFSSKWLWVSLDGKELLVLDKKTFVVNENAIPFVVQMDMVEVLAVDELVDGLIVAIVLHFIDALGKRIDEVGFHFTSFLLAAMAKT
jgi:hypothetical protein